MSSTFGSARRRRRAQMRRSRLRGHHVEDRQLALQDVVVGRQDVFLGDALAIYVGVDVARIAAHERQERAVAVGREAVGRAVALEPVAVLVDDRLAQSSSAAPPGTSARRRTARGR